MFSISVSTSDMSDPSDIDPLALELIDHLYRVSVLNADQARYLLSEVRSAGRCNCPAGDYRRGPATARLSLCTDTGSLY